MDGIIPSRITEARESRALSMGDLADSLGVTRQTISKYERGVINPSYEIVQAMSQKLNLPFDFFYKSELSSVTTGSSLFFRSRKKVPKKAKNACKYQIKWSDEIKKFLDSYVDFIAQEVPMISSDYEDLDDEAIEELALALRNKWGLGDAPIGDAIGVLENKGVIVSQFAPNNFCSFSGVDGFSSWKDGVPFIMYHASLKSAVRTRFSVFHELGHLIMHSVVSEEDSTKKEIIDLADAQADRFAAAILLPATSFPKDIHSSSLSSFIEVKKKWGVALSTIIKRCETLDLLSENQLNYLKRQMSMKRYWYNEPLDDVLTVKGPEVLRDAIFLLIESNILSHHSFISKTALSKDELQALCALPDEFFSGLESRNKPVLKVVTS